MCLLFPLLVITLLNLIRLRHKICVKLFIYLLTTRLCDLLGFIVGDCDAHWTHFFLQLIYKARVRFTRYSVCYLALGSLAQTATDVKMCCRTKIVPDRNNYSVAVTQMSQVNDNKYL